MMKKVLIVVGILVAIGAVIIGVASYGVVKVVDEAIKEKEPEFRQYISMNVEQQNAYVEKNLDFLLESAIKDSKKIEEKENLEKVKADPEARKAGMELGRSIIASLILSSDSIVKDLNAEEKSKLRAESDNMSARMEKYFTILDKY